MRARWATWLVILWLAGAAWAADAASDWQAILALDAGPGGRGGNLAGARALAVQHLAAQERALRSFRTTYPGDANAFEAGLRLARLLEIRAGFEGSEKARVEAKTLLDQLAKSATPEQRVEVDFAQVTRLMRGAQRTPKERRDEILSATRKFQAAHPSDRRVPLLLADVASLFDHQPKLKVSLLSDAAAVATDPGLKTRIADDLRRLDFLGQPVPLSFTSVQGQAVELESFRGKPVVLLCFADFSPPSTEALGKLQRGLAELPKGSVAALGISLDVRRETLSEMMRANALNWPVAHDGKSWEGPLVRSLGINTLPTVWLFDKKGRLRSLNALEGFTELARQLLQE